jgi:hypothetical protein
MDFTFTLELCIHVNVPTPLQRVTYTGGSAKRQREDHNVIAMKEKANKKNPVYGKLHKHPEPLPEERLRHPERHKPVSVSPRRPSITVTVVTRMQWLELMGNQPPSLIKLFFRAQNVLTSLCAKPVSLSTTLQTLFH